MNIETRSQARKRNRPEVFDLNRSGVEEKRRKDLSSLEMSQEDNASSQITDLSGTINAAASAIGATFMQAPSGAANNSQNRIPGEIIRQQKFLETNVQKVQTEMGDIKKTICELSEAVKALTELTRNQIGGNSSSGSGSTNGSSASEVQNVGLQASSNDNSRQHPYQGNTPLDQNRESMRIKIDKLGLRFDGNPQGLSVEEFVYRLEHYQWQYCIPWSEIIRDFPLIVSGPAESWYWLFQKTHKFHDWPELKHCLLSQYQSSRSNFEILTDLAQRKQQSNETIDMFFHNMGQIRAKLSQPITEFDMIRIMKKNIRENIGRIVYPIQVSSVEQLRIECNEAEKHFPRRDLRQAPPISRPLRQVNEVYADFPSENESECLDNEEIAAINLNRANLKCWNCHKTGHTFRDCDSSIRGLFCYRCGKPGVISPRCPTCIQGNRAQDVEKAGGLRPQQNPLQGNN